MRRPAEGTVALVGAAVTLALAARWAATDAAEADARATEATDAVLSANAMETDAALTSARCEVCEAMKLFAIVMFWRS